MKKGIFLICFSFLFISFYSQESNVLDGVYIKENTPNRKVIAYPHLREADVNWTKRVWREIDLKQKINHPLYYPSKPAQGKKNLFDVITEGLVKENQLTAYDPGVLGDDDMFRKEMTLPEIQGVLIDTVEQFVEDPVTGELNSTKIPVPITSDKVTRYEIKEDWFFDRQRSVLDVRIIGICPKIAELDPDGNLKGYKRLFWIYFPEARNVFKSIDVHNRQNDAERRTYEDIFWKRQFGSYIIKESNVYDRFISEYKVGMDALIEAENIKENVFTYEQDMWHY